MSKTFLLLLIQITLSIADTIVELPNGKILGREVTTAANTKYHAFQKIPYAAPPVGPLRFKAPQPPQDWEGVLNATYLDVSCFQLQSNSATDSEDCLFINVFTPQLPEDHENALLPVIFYVHGGAFMLGSSILAPPDLFIDNGVILVTINYRLGPFGFTSTQDETIPGNNGLKDQLLAIKWTSTNIRLFGGDPQKITLLGQSAGSASVSYQLLNQNSDGLFQGAILESGTFLNPWAYSRKAREVAFGTAALLNSSFSNSSNSEELLDFLVSIEAEDLDAAAELYLSTESTPWDFSVSQGSFWAPVIEVKNPDAFVTKKMYPLLQAGNILKVPTLMGFNSEESLLFNQDAEVLQGSLEAWDQDLDLLVQNDMQIVDSEQHAQMGIRIRDIYTEGEPFGTNLGNGIRYSSDNAFTRAIIKYAGLYSSLAETYLYQFSYDGKLGGVDVHYDGAESVGHSEEVFYLFCMDLGCNLDSYSEADKVTQKRLIKIWTDFVKYQNPTPEISELLQNITWPRVSTDEGDLLYLDINEDLEVRNHPKEGTYQKWVDLYDGLEFQDFDTY